MPDLFATHSFSNARFIAVQDAEACALRHRPNAAHPSAGPDGDASCVHGPLLQIFGQRGAEYYTSLRFVADAGASDHGEWAVGRELTRRLFAAAPSYDARVLTYCWRVTAFFYRSPARHPASAGRFFEARWWCG